ELQLLLDTLPPSLRASLPAGSSDQQIVALLLTYLSGPLYLLVPMMVASVIAADSFAGAKERRTLEALLYTPTTDRELLIAKLLGPRVAAVAVAWGGFAAYAIAANAAAWPVMGRIFFPTPMWWALARWLAPAVAGIGLGATVLVSARARTFQEAYQLGGVVVLPLVLLLVGQAAGAVFLSTKVVVLLGAALWLIDLVLVLAGLRRFRRDAILSRV